MQVSSVGSRLTIDAASCDTRLIAENVSNGTAGPSDQSASVKRTCLNRASILTSSTMLKLQLTDFTTELQTDFRVPALRDQAGLLEMVEKLTEKFAGVLDVNGIAILSEDEFFDYELTVPLFNGSAGIVIDCGSAKSTFRNGRNRQAVSLIAECLTAIYAIVANRPIRMNRLYFNAVGVFESPDSYHTFMKKFVNTDAGITSGGLTLQGSGRTFKGEIRFGSEKAAALEHGLFISSHVATEEAIESPLLAKIEERFLELANLQELEITLEP